MSKRAKGVSGKDKKTRFRYQPTITRADGRKVRLNRDFASQELLDEYLAKIRVKKYDGIELVSDRSESPVFRDFAGRWLEGVHRHESEPETVQATAASLKYHIYPKIGDYRMAEIDHKDVETIKESMVREGYAAQTIRNVLSTVSKVFTYGVTVAGIVRGNPVTFVKKPRLKTLDERDITVWDEMQQRIFLETAREHAKRDAFLAFVVDLFSGARPGEVCAIKRDALDFDNQILTIKDTWSRVLKGPKGKTKTGKIRRITLPPFVWDTLAEKRSIGPGKLIFNLSYPSFSYQLEKVVRLSGLPRITPHEIRHTFTSTMANKPGVSLKMLMDILGHVHSETTDGYIQKFGIGSVPSTNILAGGAAARWLSEDKGGSEVVTLRPSRKGRKVGEKKSDASNPDQQNGESEMKTSERAENPDEVLAKVGGAGGKKDGKKGSRSRP